MVEQDGDFLMSLPTDTDAVSAFKAGIQNLLGGFCGWLLTCSLAGIVATAAAAGDFRDWDWFWAFAWIGHLAIAAIGVWGLLVICLHAFCVSALVNGTDNVFRVLLTVFTLQLTTSTVAILCVEPENWIRSLTAWFLCILPAAAQCIFRLKSQRGRDRKRSSETIEPRLRRMYEPRPGRYGAIDRLPAASTGDCKRKLRGFIKRPNSSRQRQSPGSVW